MPPGPAVTAYLDAVAGLVGSGTVLELGSGPGWDADYRESRGPRVLRTDGAPPSSTVSFREFWGPWNSAEIDGRSWPGGWVGPPRQVLRHGHRSAFLAPQKTFARGGSDSAA